MTNKKNIQILPNHISSKIAAGEIVDRPSSVVKELIENSIDAESSQIIIHLVNGGLDTINITDNGIGIPKNQVKTSLMRFATSKISNESDLSNINTLGFRGEALHAISSVSSFSIETKFISENRGTFLESNYGKDTGIKEHGIKTGTSITVKKLFDNLPARKKFLKSASTEFQHIKNVVVNLALGFPNIQFQLFHNTKKILSTSGNGRILDAVSEIYNLEVADNLFELISDKSNDMFQGYISNNIIQNSNRKKIKLFVNGRNIEDKLLTYAIESGYKSYLNERKFPTAIINLEIDPLEIDVNIHPSKNEIKFINHQLIFSNLERLIRKTILTKSTVNSSVSNFQILSSDQNYNFEKENRQNYKASSYISNKNYFKQSELNISDYSNQNTSYPNLPFKEILTTLIVLGQLKKTFILAEGKNGLYIIDQHAAHERIIYDSLNESYYSGEIQSQKLLESLTIDTGMIQSDSLNRKIVMLNQLGYEIEKFGESAITIRSIPKIFSKNDPVNYLNDLIGQIEEEEGLNSKEHKHFATIACHSSVKAGDNLANKEMIEILEQLRTTTSPFSCPHGRPTILNFTYNKLEKDFRRIN